MLTKDFSPTSPYNLKSGVKFPLSDAFNHKPEGRRTHSTNMLNVIRHPSLEKQKSGQIPKMTKEHSTPGPNHVLKAWEQAEEIKVNKEESLSRSEAFAESYANLVKRTSDSDEKKKPRLIELRTPKNQNSQSTHSVAIKPQVPERFLRASPPKSKGYLSALKLQGDSNTIETDTTISEKLSNTTNNSRKATELLKLNELSTIRTPKIGLATVFRQESRTPANMHNQTPIKIDFNTPKASVENKILESDYKDLSASLKEPTSRTHRLSGNAFETSPNKTKRKIIDTNKHYNSSSKRSSQSESLTHLEAKNKTKSEAPKEISAVLSFYHKTRAGKLPNCIFKPNQDAFITYSNFAGSKDKYVFGVCDGHGSNGHIVSNFVKTNLPKNIEIAYKAARHLDNEHITELIRQGFSKTNRQLLNSYIDVQFSGTTVVAVTIIGTHLWCANVGDSRAILGKCRNNYWSAFPLSEDHKPNKPEERERIIKYGGRVEQLKNLMGEPVGPHRIWLKNQDAPGLAMSRSFGDTVAGRVGKIAEAEIIDMELTEEDKFIVIASDGVWEFLTNENVLEIVKPFYQSNQLDEACTCLVQKAVEKWHELEVMVDDITCVIVSLNPSVKSSGI